MAEESREVQEKELTLEESFARLDELVARMESSDISLEESYIRDEERIAVHRALGKLPGDYRQILWLVYFEDMQVRDAAAVMGRSVHAAETLIYRARRRMKEELEKVL